ncbi:MAG: hypothetical protein J6S38_07065 [Erysipelotrichaceae bacterium]|nr:hypothetical protein [Erysipelotrichaceae bacterium]
MKKLSVLLISILLALAITGCQEKRIYVNIGYEDAEGNAAGMQAETTEGPLKGILEDFKKGGDFTYELDADGKLISVNGIPNDDNGYWEIYRNDELLEENLNNVVVKDGDYFMIRYHANNTAAPGLLGGWQVAEIGRVDLMPEEEEIFKSALEGLVGVGYEPVCILAKQVVSGTNYVFLARGTTVTADPESSFYAVTVYQDLQGNTSLSNIGKIDISDIATTEEETGTLLGGWQVTQTGKPGSFGSEEATSSFETAIAELDGVRYNPIQLLATQVVSGVNYKGLAYGNVVGNEDNPSIYVVTWYADLQGNSTITEINKLDLLHYIENN